MNVLAEPREEHVQEDMWGPQVNILCVAESAKLGRWLVERTPVNKKDLKRDFIDSRLAVPQC